MRTSALFPLALACVGIACASSAKAASGLECTANTLATEWTIKHDGNVVMVYASDPQKYKPYVKELRTINGFNVLRDSPFDHLHHHALMYAIKVNDVNFWEEFPAAGVQKVISSTPPKVSQTSAGLPCVTLEQELNWLAAQNAFLPNSNAPVLLVERRTLNLTINKKDSEVALHWKSAFRVPGPTNAVLTGASYHGLGMRFQQSLDPVATHFNAAGPVDLAGTKQDVSAHAWEAVAFESSENPATIAVFGHPKNARGEPVFFAMKRPFAYLAATQSLDREPLVYKAGETFELNFLVTVWPAVKNAEAMNQRARAWQQ